jgi:hypothetical protein
MSDVEVVQECLQHCHSHAVGLKRAGLLWMVQETEAALEALERIANPTLFRWEARKDGEQDETAHAH